MIKTEEPCGNCGKIVEYRNNIKKLITFTNVSRDVRKFFCTKICKSEYIEKIKSNSKK